MNYPLLPAFDQLQDKIDLSKLCSCQLVQLADAIEKTDSGRKEEILAALFWEGIKLGISHAHDNFNYWIYVKSIGDRQVMMVIHGCYTVTFDKWLQIPAHSTKYDFSILKEEITKQATMYLPEWLKVYRKLFGVEAVTRLQVGVQHDPDIQRLIADYPFLKESFESIFGHRRQV